jgi:hypothetical protein
VGHVGFIILTATGKPINSAQENDKMYQDYRTGKRRQFCLPLAMQAVKLNGKMVQDLAEVREEVL